MKRLVQFRIWSQGSILTEHYTIPHGIDSTKVGRQLVKWFNITGGNKDRTFRRFVECPYDRVCDKKQYDEIKEKQCLNSLNEVVPFEGFQPLDYYGFHFDKIVLNNDHYDTYIPAKKGEKK
jgi:hypothetical protein